MINENRGITLIALVITVIILLILAGTAVTIGVNGGDLFSKTEKAKDKWNKAQDIETINMYLLFAQASPEYKENKEQEIASSLAKCNAKNIQIRGNNISFTLNSTNYRIKPNGEIIEYDYVEPTDIYYKYESSEQTLYLRSSNSSGYTKGTNWSTNEDINISDIKEVTIEEIIAPNTLANWFNNFTNLEKINGIRNLHTENAISMASLFKNCNNIQELDLSLFDTSKVKDIRAMFAHCSSLITLNVNHFDVTNVTSLFETFRGCSKLEELDLSQWNTSNIDTMGGWEDLGYGGAFLGCSGLKTLNLNNWDTSNVLHMGHMFDGCTSLTNLIFNLEKFDTSKVESMLKMFQYCSSLTTLDLSKFNTCNVVHMSYMFLGCTNLKTIYVSNLFNTDNVAYSGLMFRSCSNLVGGNGTAYNIQNEDKTYAVVDTLQNPGYFTLK